MDSSTTGSSEATLASYDILKFKGSELQERYINLVFSKFLRSLRYGNEYFKLINPSDYYTNYNQYIQNLINRPNSIIRLAVLSDDHDVVIGWSLIENQKLHYWYVNKDLRNNGVGSSLLTREIEEFSHITQCFLSIWNNEHKTWRFNPF